MNIKKLNEEIERFLQKDSGSIELLTKPEMELTTLYSGDQEWPLNIYLKSNEKGFSVQSELNGELVARTRIFKTVKKALDAYIELCIKENESTDIIMDLIDNGTANFVDNVYADYLYDNLSDIYDGV